MEHFDLYKMATKMAATLNVLAVPALHHIWIIIFVTKYTELV